MGYADKLSDSLPMPIHLLRIELAHEDALVIPQCMLCRNAGIACCASDVLHIALVRAESRPPAYVRRWLNVHFANQLHNIYRTRVYNPKPGLVFPAFSALNQHDLVVHRFCSQIYCADFLNLNVLYRGMEA